MWGRIAAIISLAALVAPSEALAMSSTGSARFGACTIIGGDSLPPVSGGSEGVCRAIERAVKAQAPTVRYQAEVKVISGSRLSAALVVNGKTLPEQRFAVMDGRLSSGAVERFAQAVASAVAEAAKH
jgi:hypothetical protein